MSLAYRSYLTPIHAAFLSALIGVAALSFSKALLSISTITMLVAAIWELIRTRNISLLWRSPHAWIMGSIFLLTLLSFFYAEDPARWMREIREKVPLFILPISLAVFPPFSRKQYAIIWAVFVLSHTVIAIISLGYYFTEYEVALETVSRNSNIDIAGSISHIYFGLMLAFSVILGVYIGFKKNNPLPEWMNKLLWACTIFSFLSLHLFTSRTGLLSCYIGVGVFMIGYLIQSRAWKTFTVMLLFLFLTPIIAYQTIPTFRARVNVTKWDLKQYSNNRKDLSNLSASMRLLAWENAWDIFLQHPILGTGISDLEDAMQVQYDAREDLVAESARLQNPHNQYLEYLAGFGVVGFLILLSACLYPLANFKKPPSIIMISFVALIMAGMIFESILERQIGITFFVLFMVLLEGYRQRELSPE